MKPSKYYRQRYFDTLEDAEALVERWRIGATRSREERDAVWVWASEFVHRFARQYYKRSQNTSRGDWYQRHILSGEHDRHNARVVALLDLLADPKYDEQTAVWVMAAYRRRFAQFEALAQLRESGVGMSEWGKPLHEQTVPVITWVYISKLEREVDRTGDTLRDVWERTETRYKRNVTEQRWQNFLRRWAWYTELKEITQAKFYYDDTDVPTEDIFDHA